MKRFLFVIAFACTIGYIANSAANTATSSIVAHSERVQESVQ